jgi:hypothetical protein
VDTGFCAETRITPGVQSGRPSVNRTAVMPQMHTPGPWRVFDALKDPEIVTDRPTAHETESLVQFKGQANAAANARLMAVAPALFAARAALAKGRPRPG